MRKETDMSEAYESTQSTTTCPAKELSGAERQQIAIDVLAGVCTVSYAAQEYQVSRKFVYQQVNSARDALDQTFAPDLHEAHTARNDSARDDKVLFYLPVTKGWLKQLVLALVLVGSCS